MANRVRTRPASAATSVGSTVDPHAIKLKILHPTVGEYTFLVPGELDGLYAHSNNYRRVTANRQGVVKEGEYLWYSGNDDAVTLKLLLLVGASYRVDTPEDLKQAAEDLASMSHVEETTGAGVPQIVVLRIGSWFYRKAVINKVSVGFASPYDPDTGLPYRANVVLTLAYVYGVEPTDSTFAFDEG